MMKVQADALSPGPMHTLFGGLEGERMLQPRMNTDGKSVCWALHGIAACCTRSIRAHRFASVVHPNACRGRSVSHGCSGGPTTSMPWARNTRATSFLVGGAVHCAVSWKKSTMSLTGLGDLEFLDLLGDDFRDDALPCIHAEQPLLDVAQFHAVALQVGLGPL